MDRLNRTLTNPALIFMLATFFCVTGLSQSMYTIALKDNDGKVFNPINTPLKIIVSGTNGSTPLTFPSTGVLAFSAYIGDKVKFYNASDNSLLDEYTLTAVTAKDIILPKKIADAKFNLPTNAAASSANYWIGASIAYNISGGTSDDIVGGSKIKINPLALKSKSQSFSVIGNVGTFFSNTDNAENQKAIAKLAQSQTGLGIGLGYILEVAKKGITDEELAGRKLGHRIELTTNYRLNSFKDPSNADESIGLNQWRNTFLYEVYLGGFQNEGQLTFSSEISYSLFSADTYQRIFSKNQGRRLTLETTLMVPLSEKIGFMVNVISTKDISPTYQFGFAIKTDE